MLKISYYGFLYSSSTSCFLSPHFSHKQQNCQTAGQPERADHLSTAEHWKPATGAVKYIKSFSYECIHTHLQQKVPFIVCVWASGSFECRWDKHWSLATFKTGFEDSPNPTYTLKVQSSCFSFLFLSRSLIQKLCLFFVSPTNRHPHPTVLPLVCFIFPVALLCANPSLPSCLCFLLQPACCISSPPQRGSGISCNHLYLCSVPPVSAGSCLLCCCTPHIQFWMQLYPTAVKQVGVVYNYALCIFVPAMFLDVFAHA